MKRLILAATLLVATASAVKAQNFEVGDNNITLTTGITDGFNVPIALSYERGIVNLGEYHKLGAGGHLHFANSYTYIAGEFNYHFVGFEKFDLYGGVRLGYRSIDILDDLHSTVNIGSNYYFTPSWAINVEVGSGLTHLNAGLTFKF